MVWIYADILSFWGGDIDAKVKVHRKPFGSALLSISGISHETKNFSGLHSITGSKIFLIGGKMRIIKISARVRNGYQFGIRQEAASLFVQQCRL